jgi:hypothetical protein
MNYLTQKESIMYYKVLVLARVDRSRKHKEVELDIIAPVEVVARRQAVEYCVASNMTVRHVIRVRKMVQRRK